MKRLIGPFKQLLTLDRLAKGGHLSDDAHLEIILDAGILVEDGKIISVGPFGDFPQKDLLIESISFPAVAVPGLIDAHTHICFAGSRYRDYALRLKGLSYQEIARQGGGIMETVQDTRTASQSDLETLLLEKTRTHLLQGVTTCEVKSGYGLTLEDEIKILKAIGNICKRQPIDLIPTCLAAHIKPPEFETAKSYLDFLTSYLFPKLIEGKLTERIDIFVESGAFSVDEARDYLLAAKKAGFKICLHADQFSRGGALLAAEVGALSADHLEVSTEDDFDEMNKKGVIPVVLPGSSLGLGVPFAPAKKMLDRGLPLAIASDWNPGSAPMGNLLTQAALIGMAEKLTIAETLAGITVRAARALGLADRGVLCPKMKADFIVFPCKDYREIFYYQGFLKPSKVYIDGIDHISAS